MSGNPYNIIVRRIDKESYQAIVVYGPNSRVFAAGAGKTSDREALLHLLETTHALVGGLYSKGKLPSLENGKSVIPGGMYDPQSGR